MDDERFFEIRENRRYRNEARLYDKWQRLYEKAAELVGELCCNGQPVYYINVRAKSGRLTGAIKRFDRQCDAETYLIRNRYV